jgi:hypothetical protein
MATRANARDKGKGRAVEEVEVIDNVGVSELVLSGNRGRKRKAVDTNAVVSPIEPRKLRKRA